MSQGASSPLDPQPAGDASIPPEDLQVITALYQRCPKLWGVFKDIISVVDLLEARPQADEHLVRALIDIDNHVESEDEDILRFIAVSGFVEKCVAMSRQILRDQGKGYITEFPTRREQVNADIDTRCLLSIRDNMLSCTYVSADLSLRLVKTGFLHDLLEDVKHIQHLSVEALERGRVFLLSLGTIHNCCLYPESVAVVRRMDIAPHITPFLTKRSHNQFIQSVAAAVLGYVTNEHQLDLLTTTGQLVQYFMDDVEQALATRKASYSAWRIKELLHALWLLARNDFNKKLFVAQGMLGTLRRVLDPVNERSEKEKQQAVDIISRLTEDRANLAVCQGYQELLTVLRGLLGQGDRLLETSGVVQGLLERLQPCLVEEKDADVTERLQARFPELARLLEGQSNILSILHMEPAEFLLQEMHQALEQRQAVTGAEDRQGEHCVHVLRALKEITTHQHWRRDLMARGGLVTLLKSLQAGSSQQQTHAAEVILSLTSSEENRAVIQINAELLSFFEYARQREDHPELARQADAILQTLGPET